MSRPIMGSPQYVYQPLSAEQRQRMRDAAIKRSGAKPGHRIVYKINVPQRYWPLISKLAAEFRNRNRHTAEETRAYIRRLLRLLKAGES